MNTTYTNSYDCKSKIDLVDSHTKFTTKPLSRIQHAGDNSEDSSPTPGELFREANGLEFPLRGCRDQRADLRVGFFHLDAPTRLEWAENHCRVLDLLYLEKLTIISRWKKRRFLTSFFSCDLFLCQTRNRHFRSRLGIDQKKMGLHKRSFFDI